jgi:tetratricopeptide (TPR) repeat protein
VDGVLYLAVPLADAVGHAHAHGVLHRDLKPSNVLIRTDGRPMLLDFNLSLNAADGPAFLGGTLPYMAPEQLRALAAGEKTHLPPPDPRSDLFSLGVILYELLARKHPFEPVPLKLSEEALCGLLLDRQRQGARPLREVNPEVDAGLSRLVEGCLAYDPAGRPQSAAELAAGLRRCLAPPRRLRRWSLRHPRIAVAAALVLGLGLFAALGALGASRPGRQGVAGVAQPWLLSPAARAYNRGQEAYRRGDFAQAADDFTQALEADPKMRTAALFARGRAYQQRGDQEDFKYFNLALADFVLVEQLAPEGKVNACMGYCYNRQSFHRDAIYQYTLARCAAFRVLGASTVGLLGTPPGPGPYPAAAALFPGRARDVPFESPELLNNLGYCYHKTGQLEKARQILDLATRLGPGLEAAYHNRALLHFQKALNLKRRVVEAARKGVPPEPAVAPEFERTLKAGLADIDQAVKLGPPSGELYFSAARLYALAAGLLEPPEKGIEFLRRALTCGANLADLKADVALGPLWEDPRGQALFHNPPAREPQQPLRGSPRLADPLKDGPG